MLSREIYVSNLFNIHFVVYLYYLQDPTEPKGLKGEYDG